jgi:hypothetical protein
MSASRVAARLARALGFTPSQDQVASALLGVPPAQARAELYRQAAAALAATAARSPPPRAEFATKAKRLGAFQPHRSDERLGADEETARASRARFPSPPSPPVAVRASSVAGAGAGLFATKPIRKGQLVALYGGVYVPPVPPVTPGADGVSVVIPAPTASDDDAALDYVIHLASGGYLDGAAHAAAARAAAEKGQCHGWGVAALANHPPKGVTPNVVAMDVAWGETRFFSAKHTPETVSSPSHRGGDRESLASHASRTKRLGTSETRYVVSESCSNRVDVERLARDILNPVKREGPWYVDGATGCSVAVPPTVPTVGVAFVASTTLDPGTEIFFDYRLSAKPLPAWYAPVPAEVAWRIVDERERRRKHEKNARDEEGDSDGREARG